MIKQAKLMVGAALCMVMTSPVSAGLLDDLYVSGATGVTITSDSDFEQSGVTGDIEIDNAANIALAVGKNINDNVRAEIELSYRNSGLDQLNVDGVGSANIGGDLKTTAVLLNGYYDFQSDRKLSPYVTAGIGLAHHDGEMTGGGVSVDADDTVFAYQIGAGANYTLGEQTSLFGGYRYLGSADADLDGLDAEYDAHEIRIGMRYNF